MKTRLEILAADKCDVWVHYCHNIWIVNITTDEKSSVKLEIKENGKDLEEVFTSAYSKYNNITGRVPELRPLAIAPPEEIPETPYREIPSDEIPF